MAVPLTSQVGSRSPTAPSETPPPPPETLFLSFFFSIFKELPFIRPKPYKYKATDP